MYFVEEAERNYREERVGYARFQRVHGRLVYKQIGILFALFMGLKILWSRWLIKSEPTFSIGLHF
jgi:hypothetical protein